jgi:hypothetical protein
VVKVFRSKNSTIWLENLQYSQPPNWPSIKDSKYEELDIAIGDFFDKIASDPKEVGYYYLSGNLSEFDSPSLAADVSPTDFFLPSNPSVCFFFFLINVYPRLVTH